jgi:L-asparaginase
MKILFIQTGGTIDKDYPKTTKGYAFEIDEPAVKRILEKIKPDFNYEILPLMRKDSLDITNNDRKKILQSCIEADTDKIIITHGTDTMIESAKFLSSIKNKSIVLTGAVKPERFKDSDAEFNLGVAIGAVNELKNGIYIAMNGRIIPAGNIQRDNLTGKFA